MERRAHIAGLAAAMLAAGAAAGAQPPAGADDFCADLARIVAAAAEEPAFASLGERTRLGESDRCGVFTDHRGQGHVHCVFAWTISSVRLDTAPLAERTERCPTVRLRRIPARRDADGGDRFLAEGSGGVEVASITHGCQECRGGETLLLVVDGPVARGR